MVRWFAKALQKRKRVHRKIRKTSSNKIQRGYGYDRGATDLTVISVKAALPYTNSKQTREVMIYSRRQFNSATQKQRFFIEDGFEKICKFVFVNMNKMAK